MMVGPNSLQPAPVTCSPEPSRVSLGDPWPVHVRIMWHCAAPPHHLTSIAHSGSTKAVDDGTSASASASASTASGDANAAGKQPTGFEAISVLTNVTHISYFVTIIK